MSFADHQDYLPPEQDEPRGWTAEQNFRERCLRCGRVAIVCCGSVAMNSFWCVECCEHPYNEDL